MGVDITGATLRVGMRVGFAECLLEAGVGLMEVTGEACGVVVRVGVAAGSALNRAGASSPTSRFAANRKNRIAMRDFEA